MITDKYSNTLYLSDKLESDYPTFYKGFSKILYEKDVSFKTLKDTKDIWCRDFMPIQIEQDRFIQFDYSPSYLKGYEHTISDVSKLAKQIGINPIKSKIKLDGGNVVKSDDKAILTDRIFKENPDFKHNTLLNELEELFEAEVIIIPAQPYDDLGHSDGVVRFFDKNTLLVNNYSNTKESKTFQNKLYGTLGSHGFNIIQIPYYPEYSRNKDGNQSAKGTYINFLRIENTVFLPFFNQNDEDSEAFEIFERLYGKNVIPVQCSEIANQSGVLNCISWNIYQFTASPNKLPKRPVDFESLTKHVFEKVTFRLFKDEFEDIEKAFREVWNNNSGELLGDGDCKNAVYRKLEKLDRNKFIPQYVVDGVIDELLNYMEINGQYGHDYSIN